MVRPFMLLLLIHDTNNMLFVYPNVQSQHMSPTPQAVFQAAPATHIMDEDDDVERASLIPELQRVLSSVNEVLSSALPNERRREPEDTSPFSPSSDTAHLPWRLPNHGIETNISSPEDDSSDTATFGRRSDPRSQLNIAQLRQLAPLIDRLGRTLTDAAPHIAALADSLPSSVVEDANASQSLLEEDHIRSLAATASHLYFGTGDEPATSSSNEEQRNTASPVVTEEGVTTNDPDLTDYINGMVNTTRGGNRNDRESNNRDPLATDLLASYLSSAAGIGSLGGQPITTGLGGGVGGAGPGIDIHIHAVVTGSNGMPSFGGAGGGATATTTTTNGMGALTSILTNNNFTTPSLNASGGAFGGINQQTNQDDTDLFSDLYSESPSGVNLHGQENEAVATTTEIEESCNDLTQMFDECRSIEGESEESDLEPPLDDEAVITGQLSNESAEKRTTVSSDSHDGVGNNISTADASSGNNGTLTLSEIESTSQESIASPYTASTSQLENQRSSSLPNRLFRRTLGRFSSVSSRRQGGRGGEAT